MVGVLVRRLGRHKGKEEVRRTTLEILRISKKKTLQRFCGGKKLG